MVPQRGERRERRPHRLSGKPDGGITGDGTARDEVADVLLDAGHEQHDGFVVAGVLLID